MELISRVSKGSAMDQVYISKNRSGFEVGSYVVITPALKKQEASPYYYHTEKPEPIKIQIISEIFEFLDDSENAIITGSFLNKGFDFEDIDIVVINGTKKPIEWFIADRFGIKSHIMNMTYESLRKGANTDPLFRMLLSRFVAKKRIFLKIESKINYKLLDIYLLKSKLLINNFDSFNGKEKYRLIRNTIAIKRFMESKKISDESVNKDINNCFGKDAAVKIKNNTFEKNIFIKKYKVLHNELFEKIMMGIKNDEKQK